MEPQDCPVTIRGNSVAQGSRRNATQSPARGVGMAAVPAVGVQAGHLVALQLLGHRRPAHPAACPQAAAPVMNSG